MTLSALRSKSSSSSTLDISLIILERHMQHMAGNLNVDLLLIDTGMNAIPQLIRTLYQLGVGLTEPTLG